MPRMEFLAPLLHVAAIWGIGILIVRQQVPLLGQTVSLFRIEVNVDVSSALGVDALDLMVIRGTPNRKVTLTDVNRDPVTFRILLCIDVIPVLTRVDVGMTGPNVVGIFST